MSESDATSRGARTSVLLAGLSVLLVAHAWYLACPAEDAHITFRFARHVAAGEGFVWNLGEPPIEGFTTVLWVLVSALAIALGANVILVTQTLGVLAAVGSLLLTYRVATRYMGVSERLALVPCVFLALSGPHATWASSGMETTAFGFFVLASFAQYLRHLERRTLGTILAAAGLLVVAAFLRPEAALVFVVLLGWTLLEARREAPRRLAPAGVFALAFVLPMLLLLAFRVRTFGDYLPNTYYAKTGGGARQFLRGLIYVHYFAFAYVLGFSPLLVLALSRRSPANIGARSRLERARKKPALTLSLAVVAVHLAYWIAVGGDYMAMFRFVAPVLPFLYLLLLPVVSVLRDAAESPGLRRATTVAVVFALVFTIVQSTPLEGALFAAAPYQHGTYRGVVLERWHVARLRSIAEFFSGYARGPRASIATDAIGALGFYSELAVHDLSGLTDRHIARTPIKEPGMGLAGHERLDLNYSFHRLPTYFLLARELAPVEVTKVMKPAATMSDLCQVLGALYPKSVKILSWMRNNEAFVRQHYRLVAAPILDLENEEKGFLAFLERVE
jgi:hypothetical protein